MFIEYNIYRTLKKYVSVIYLIFTINSVISCKTPPVPSRNSIPLPYNDIKNGQIKVEETEQFFCDNADDFWEKFFKEREASGVWNVLQSSTNSFFLNSIIKEHPNEVITGVIQYIRCLSYRNPQYLNVPIYIYLTGNKYEQPISLPREIGFLTNLCQLNLSNGNFIDIPANIGELKNLKVLNLSRNKLKSIPPHIGNIHSLSSLDLSSNYLQELPVELNRLIKLYDLNLSSNQFDKIPSTVSNLSKLKYCDLSFNRITIVDSSIKNMVSLENLKLRRNKIKKVSSKIGKLVGLRYIDLSSNQIKRISSQIEKLTNLNFLNLSNNKLTSIPIEIRSCIGLKNLMICNNRIKSLPIGIVQLVNIQCFKANNNHLESIPFQIGKLSKLTELDLSNNKLLEIPEQLCKLSNLKKLELANNQLTALPYQLHKLSNLEEFNISYNQLKKLPISFLDKVHSSSFRLFFSNNPWLDNIYLQGNTICKDKLKRDAQQKFPHSLLVLCMQVIEDYSLLYSVQGLDSNLPQELHQSKRIKLLQQAYQWKEGKNIVQFRTIGHEEIPFYLDYPLNNFKSLDSLLEKLPQEPIYQISENNS